MEQIKNQIRQIEESVKDMITPDVLSACLGFIDLTSLNSTDTSSKIISMTQKVNSFPLSFGNYPQVAAICVYPNFAEVVKETLTDKRVKIAVVAGVFPSSQSFAEIKSAECKLAAQKGADEIDIVLSLNHFLADNSAEASREISLMKEAAGDAHLKVILESGILNDPALIYKASLLSMEAGADFIKTSTGKSEPAATPEAAVVMCTAIRDYYEKTGKKVGFKPAGGIIEPEDAVKYYAIVRTILGVEWLNSNYFRIGASRLANNLLSALEKKNVNYF